MKKLYLILIVIFCVSCSSLAKDIIIDCPDGERSGTTGNICGRVIDEKENPLVAVKVSVNEYYHSISDSTGCFKFENIRAGIYTISAKNDKFISTTPNTQLLFTTQTEVKVKVGCTTKNVIIKLTKVSNILFEDAVIKNEIK